MSEEGRDLTPPRIGVLVSGSGSNLQALLSSELGAPIALVISNRADAFALERATKHGIETQVLSHKGYDGRERYDQALVSALEAKGVTHVVLAGFMRIVTRVLLDAFPRRVLNIHPALLPAFPGLDAQKQAFDARVLISGCTVHLVDDGVDTGPVLAQAAVAVQASDDLDALRARILAEEHALLPFVVRKLIELGLTETERGPALAGHVEVPARPGALWSVKAVRS